MRLFLLCAYALLFSGLFSTAFALGPELASAAKQQDTAAQGNTIGKPSGEEVFKANCARCHMPPMSLSPRITGTVVMHMRARARLSREDEKLLLKYLAP